MVAVATLNDIIPLEKGWNGIAKAIDKLEAMLNGGMKDGQTKMFGPREYVSIYTATYNMCTQRSPFNWSRELYQRHGQTIERYLTTNVLPALRDKTGQGGTILLSELQHRWINHQIMNKWLRKFFTYLDRYYVKRNNLPTLSQAGRRCFRTHIYDEMKRDTTHAILSLINDEREGKIIDKSLVKSIVELYEGMGMGSLEVYNADLEEPLLASTREYYTKKREDWINDSTQDYLIKAQEALNEERNRVADYLKSSSESKILKVVEEEILEKVEMSNLKVQCGTQFTSKMEGVLADLAVGSQQRQEFEQRMRQVESKLDLSVQVLKRGFCPTYKSPEVALTEEMSKGMTVFTESHEQKHLKRKLLCLLTQGSATARGLFGKKSYGLQKSTLQPKNHKTMAAAGYTKTPSATGAPSADAIYEEQYHPPFLVALVLVPCLIPLFWNYHVRITKKQLSFGYSGEMAQETVGLSHIHIQSVQVIDRINGLREWGGWGIRMKLRPNREVGYIPKNGSGIRIVYNDEFGREFAYTFLCDGAEKVAEILRNEMA